MSDNANISYSDVLYEMREIRDAWRRNTFTYEEGQEERYQFLLEVRRVRIAQLYADGQVYTGGMQS